MGSSTGLAGLKCLQWLFRGIEFGCSSIILGIYSYYIATMVNHSITVPTGVKAVEGISAVGTLYTLLGFLLVCCCAGHPAPSFISMIFDICLAGAYIYIAVVNRDGASSCSSGTLDTVYGSGDAHSTPKSDKGGTKLPTFQMACKMETACLIVACVAVRYRASRPIRDADGEYITKSDYYGGAAAVGAAGAPPQRRHARRGFWDFGAFRGAGAGAPPPPPANPDMLPAHQQVGDVQTRQVEVWGEVSSLHDSDRLYFNDGASRDEHGPPVRMTSTTAPRPAAEEYNEGDVGDREYGLYREDEHGNDHSEVGRVSKHHESKAARVERLEAA